MCYFGCMAMWNVLKCIHTKTDYCIDTAWDIDCDAERQVDVLAHQHTNETISNGMENKNGKQKLEIHHKYIIGELH